MRHAGFGQNGCLDAEGLEGKAPWGFKVRALEKESEGDKAGLRIGFCENESSWWFQPN